MTFFDQFKEKVTDLAQAGVAKSKQLAEIAKLKAANMSEQDAIRKAYLEIGKLYYAEKGSTPEGGYAAACARITEAKTNIAANNAKIEKMKDGDADVEAAAADAVVEEFPALEAAAEEVLVQEVTPEDIADEETTVE